MWHVRSVHRQHLISPGGKSLCKQAGGNAGSSGNTACKHECVPNFLQRCLMFEVMQLADRRPVRGSAFPLIPRSGARFSNCRGWIVGTCVCVLSIKYISSDQVRHFLFTDALYHRLKKKKKLHTWDELCWVGWSVRSKNKWSAVRDTDVDSDDRTKSTSVWRQLWFCRYQHRGTGVLIWHNKITVFQGNLTHNWKLRLLLERKTLDEL